MIIKCQFQMNPLHSLYKKVINLKNLHSNKSINHQYQQREMSFFKPQEGETQQFMLGKISQFTEEIMSKNEKVHFQRAHDYVFKLCQQQKQEQLLETIYGSMRKILPLVFDSLEVDSQMFLSNLTQLLTRIQRSVKTVKDMCLYIDHSYFKDPKQKIIYKLNKIFLQQLFKKESLIAELGRSMARIHIMRNDYSLESIIKTIKTIDSQEEYFVNHFVQYYLPVLTQSLSKQAQQSFTEAESNKNIEAYIEFAHQKLQLQQKFLNKFWPDNKHCLNNKTYIMKQVYIVVVTQYKGRIYENHNEKLFNELTLQILELFKYNPSSNDVEKHAQWYNGQIKNKLQTLKLDNNTQFIDSFCEFYNNIMTLLEKTHNKFDIHYRSRFAFEEWINEEKLQMPARLNDYIKEYCLGGTKSSDKRIQQNIGIVFVLMKQKNLFEKTYRRLLIDRLVENYGHYDMTREQAVIALMQKQCSQQFVKNIQPIVQSHIATSNQVWQKNTVCENVKLNVFLLNSQNWPYDQKHITDITIDQNLLTIVEKQTLRLNEESKDKTLYWHPIIGVVVMRMRFMQSKWQGQLVVNTCMANVLLHFKKTSYQPFQLKTFCLSTGYKPDQLYESIKKLTFIKLLFNNGTEDNYILAINQQFTFPQQTCNILQIQTTNKFESKPLQQLKADRKFMVEAIIVKLMKKLKLTDKQNILKQTAPLIQKRGFSYNAKFVQSAIQRLVDKQFIRDYEDGRYGYIA